MWSIVGSGESSKHYPSGGLCHYLHPPESLASVINEPIHAVVYGVFVVGFYTIISRKLIDHESTATMSVCENAVFGSITYL